MKATENIACQSFPVPYGKANISDWTLFLSSIPMTDEDRPDLAPSSIRIHEISSAVCRALLKLKIGSQNRKSWKVSS